MIEMRSYYLPDKIVNFPFSRSYLFLSGFNEIYLIVLLPGLDG